MAVKNPYKEQELRFDGTAYVPELDKKRLSKQIGKIYLFMVSGEWRTLSEISEATDAPEASASACLRDFRKPRFGGHTVNKRRRGDPRQGLFEYQLLLNKY